jgi:hypothetical protein
VEGVLLACVVPIVLLNIGGVVLLFLFWYVASGVAFGIAPALALIGITDSETVRKIALFLTMVSTPWIASLVAALVERMRSAYQRFTRK